MGPLTLVKDIQVVDDLEKMFPDLLAGGQWHPRNCIARDRVAILIPYRNREEHLYILLRNLHPMLQKQQLDYGIFVIEQAGKFLFMYRYYILRFYHTITFINSSTLILPYPHLYSA